MKKWWYFSLLTSCISHVLILLMQKCTVSYSYLVSQCKLETGPEGAEIGATLWDSRETLLFVTVSLINLVNFETHVWLQDTVWNLLLFACHWSAYISQVVNYGKLHISRKFSFSVLPLHLMYNVHTAVTATSKVVAAQFIQTQLQQWSTTFLHRLTQWTLYYDRCAANVIGTSILRFAIQTRIF